MTSQTKTHGTQLGHVLVLKSRASDVAATLPVSHEITKLLRIEDLSGTFLVIL